MDHNCFNFNPFFTLNEKFYLELNLPNQTPKVII